MDEYENFALEDSHLLELSDRENEIRLLAMGPAGKNARMGRTLLGHNVV